MSIPSWPVTLPQKLTIDDFQQTLPDVLIKTDMDAGPPKVRRRFTAGIASVEGHIYVTSAQLETLIDFYNLSLLGGSLRFAWLDPTFQEYAEMRFTKPPTWQSINDDINVGYQYYDYDVSMNLEILP
jgi:hypothetical protein